MMRIQKLLGIAVVCSLLTLGLVSPAYAFDGRGGDKVIIAAGDVVNDDLYVGATEFSVDGTVNGDVIAAGKTIAVNGTINGNLLAAAQTVVINGTIAGDVIAAGSVLFFGEESKVGGDVVGAGSGLEFRKGSAVGRDAVLAAGQILLAGEVTRNVKAGANKLEIRGTIGGSVQAAVGEADRAQAGIPPSMMMPGSPVAMPIVKPGITINPAAKIGGNLEYTQNSELAFPAGVIHGKTTRMPQPESEDHGRRAETLGDKAGTWALMSVRSGVTLILLGLLLLWRAPGFLKALSDRLRATPLPSLGWGMVAYAGFFFLLLLTVFVVILGAIVFGLLTLGGFSGATVWVGILAMLALVLGFVLATSFLAKIIFGMTLGKWILVSAKSPLAEHRYWPMVMGVILTVAVVGTLTFPAIPGILGWLVNFAIILFGLGTLWLWGRERLQSRPAATA